MGIERMWEQCSTCQSRDTRREHNPERIVCNGCKAATLLLETPRDPLEMGRGGWRPLRVGETLQGGEAFALYHSGVATKTVPPTPAAMLGEALEHMRKAEALVIAYQRATSFGHHATAAVTVAVSEVSAELGSLKKGGRR